MRVYEIGFAHPIGDFTGDLAKALSFPDAKNTTFKIEGVSFPFPKKNGTSNDFQISFTAQDFSHATYFCVNIFYNLDTGEFKMVDQENKEPTCASFGGCYCKSNHYCHVPPQPTSCTADAQCRTSWYPSSYCQGNLTHAGSCHMELPPRCQKDSDCDGNITTAKNGEAAAPIQATYASSEAITGPTLFKEDTDQNHCFDLQVMNNNTECFKEYWIKHQYQFFGFNKGRCPPQYTVENRKTNICGTNVVARNLGKALTQKNKEPTASKQNNCQKLNSNYCSGSKSDPQGTCCDNMFCKYWQAPIGRTCMGCYSCKCDNGGPGSTDDPSKCVNNDGKLCPFVEEC